MFKYRLRKEDGRFITTIEKDGVRIATRNADSHEEAIEARDSAQGAGLSNFDEFMAAPSASTEKAVMHKPKGKRKDH